MQAMLREYEVYAVPTGGSPLRALLPEEGTARFDPFLAFHEQGPVRYEPRRALGFPDHPHRGIETITYVVAGEQYHRDSFGHEGILNAGDVQWMSAAAGIIHSELPTERLFEEGGEVHAFQLWLNLPKVRKMTPPRYQDVAAARLPAFCAGGVRVCLIAGELDGVSSPVDCGRPFVMAHIVFETAAARALEVPAGSTVIAYALAGAGTIDDAPLRAGEIAVGRERRTVRLASATAGFALMLVAAQPLHEPVVSRGPFVMTSQEEIEHAYRDLIDGRFGHDARVGRQPQEPPAR